MTATIIDFSERFYQKTKTISSMLPDYLGGVTVTAFLGNDNYSGQCELRRENGESLGVFLNKELALHISTMLTSLGAYDNDPDFSSIEIHRSNLDITFSSFNEWFENIKHA